MAVRGRWTTKAHASAFCAATGAEMLLMDPAQTFPFQTVVISGSGYVPSCAVTVQVIRPDGSIVRRDAAVSGRP